MFTSQKRLFWLGISAKVASAEALNVSYIIANEVLTYGVGIEAKPRTIAGGWP